MNTTQSPPQADLVRRSERLDGYLQHDPSNEQLLADAFDAAMAAGRTDAAQTHVLAGLRVTASPDSWKFRQASCAIARGELSVAVDLLAGLTTAARSEPAVQFNLGLVHYRLKQYQACADALQPLIDQADRLEWVHKAQAMWLRAMHRLGEVERAWSWFAQAQLAGRDFGAEVNGIASLLALDADHLDQVNVLALRALQQLPAQPEAMVARGSVALGQGDAALAAASAQAVLRDHGDDGRTRSLLAFAMLLAQDLPGALGNFEQAVALMPGHVGTWQGLGWTQLLMGKLDAAVLAFSTALDIDRNFAENHGALAVAFAMQGRLQEAALEVERAVRLDPTVASAQYAKLLLGGQGRDPAEIQRLAQRLLTRLSPTGRGT